MPEWLKETLHPGIGQYIRVDRILHTQKTPTQELLIFENEFLGRVLALDGVIQTTEVDEFIYHEMITHTPILTHGSAQKILVLGGGDGGVIKELFKYRTISKVVMVEIDSQVIQLCQQYLPSISRGAFEDPRLDLVISDGAKYVANCPDHFDIIIVDSPDPIGPGENLFSNSFYRYCHQCLKPNGILVTQNGVPFVQREELRNSVQYLSEYFKHVSLFTSSIPTYYGGEMAFGWASDQPFLESMSLGQIRFRFSAAEVQTRHYCPELHLAAFAIPPWIREIAN